MAGDIGTAYGTGRVTPQRRLIAQSAAEMVGAFTVEELAGKTRVRDEATGLATVYRAVTALLASGWLEHVGERHGRALYARCHAGGHHHHVVCDRCGRIQATECPVVVAPGDSGSEGFVITRHEVTLYGLCPECAAGEPAGGGA